MFERHEGGNRAVLVALDLPGGGGEPARQEFVQLARGTGAEIVGVIGGQRKVPEARLFVGSGKAEEVAAAVRANEADLVIFNHQLSPAQERNLEQVVQARVLDRNGLILDIFARRARTHEGKLQVELAQLNYMATRLVRGWSHLERQKGGIGLRGPGETQLETDRRLLGERVKHVERRIEQVRRTRDLNRARRQRQDVPLVSLVGYTNAGKSTLFERLTGNDTYVADQLFATLDTTLRRIPLTGADPVILADTVGFIRELPHTLVAAFRATLEETIGASLLLHVIDASDSECTEQRHAVEGVLEEIGASEVPRLDVMNKIDCIDGAGVRVDRDEAGRPLRVWIAAAQGLGLDTLREAMIERLYSDYGDVAITLPADAGRLRAELHRLRAVMEERFDNDGVGHLTVRLPRQRLIAVCGRFGVDPTELIDEPGVGTAASSADNGGPHTLH